ncbi:hypothetical protein BG003_008457 [Podila horticola]|nr:hypothetical protein BG003_008457 [Podila horticola]
MPSTPVRPLSNHLVINTHNLSQAHNRGSPRSANANSALSAFKDSNRPVVEKRHSFGPSALGPHAHSNNSSSNLNHTNAPISAHLPGMGDGSFHGHLGHSYGRSRQSLALTVLRILACVPGFMGMMYSLNQSWDESKMPVPTSDDETTLVRSDFWCGLSVYWAFLLTTALIQRLLQSYRPPLVVIRVALAHLISWTVIGIITQSRPATEPTRPWIIITFGQALLLFLVVYLPWFRSQMEAAGFPRLSEKLTSHPLEDGFMGREISGQSATRLLILPLVVVGLCSWMLIITRGPQGGNGELTPGIRSPQEFPSAPQASSAGSFLTESDRHGDNRMAISMIILSSATQQGYLNRKLFRETTLKLFPSPRNKAVLVKYRFIIGNDLSPTALREINQEHSQTGDLAMLETADTPDKKSLKLYKAIEWANKYDFDYLVKTDDDVLVRMDILSGELFKQGKKQYFWKGLVFKNVPNTRLDDMDLKEMPKFTDGTLTTLSRDIVRLLGVPAPRYLVENNGQSLGIWLHGYGIQPIHDSRIQPGAFICEEDLIAKHFDNEASLNNYPRDDPIQMVERINQIRAELKKNKANPKFQTSVSICNNLIQKRCAICYSCQGRASNWKQMGFDCKSNGIIVGDNYRRPEMLDAQQMNELVNRPESGISDDFEGAIPKDNRPEARLQRQEAERQRLLLESEVKEEGEEEEYSEDDNTESGDGASEDGSQEGEGALAPQGEQEALDEQGQGEDAEYSEPEGEEGGEGGEGGGEEENTDGEDEGHGDEAEMSISDLEVEQLERRLEDVHEAESLKQSAEKRSGRKKATGKNKA